MEFKSKIYDKQAFKNISCVGQDLSDKDFSDCSFEKCDFSECNFSNSSFNSCSFFGCNLTNIKVNNCSFQGVIFEKSKLLGTRFSTLDSLLIGWTFISCVITICDFGDLSIKDSKFIDCDIREADFINTNLSGSDFSGSSLLLCKFHNTNLEKVNFIGARDYYINPIDNKLKGARFSYPEVLSLLDGFGIKVEF